MNLKAKFQASKFQAQLDALDRALHNAEKPNLELLAKIVAEACTRISCQPKTEAFDRLIHFGKIDAWTDAAFALIALELPLWRVRRLVYENGEWRCSLSCQPNLPMDFDECAEATHEVLPLAMLCALVEGCRSAYATRESASTVPHIQPWPEQAMCCENYR